MAAVPDLTAVLASAQSPDAATRQAAEASLKAASEADPAAFLAALAAELAGEGRPPETRQIAGLILKNALDAPSEAKKVRGRGRGGEGREGRAGGAPRPHPDSFFVRPSFRLRANRAPSPPPPLPFRPSWQTSGEPWTRASRPRSGGPC